MKFAGKPIVIGLSLPLFLLGASCSQQKMSEQEKKRQQEILSADNLRSELQGITGEYLGQLTGTGGFQQEVTLSLANQDVPVPVDGNPDPVLTPKLVGTLRFLYGDPGVEYIDLPIRAAEYISTQATVNLVLSHAQFNELIMNLMVENGLLSGKWNAPSLGVAGQASLRKK